MDEFVAVGRMFGKKTDLANGATARHRKRRLILKINQFDEI